MSPSSKPAVSTRRHSDLTLAPAAKTSNTGATIKSPVASPSHQIHQRAPKSVHESTPPKHNELTPTVALTVVLTPAAQTIRLNTSRNRPSAQSKSNHLLSSQAPAIASKVLPTAIPAATATVSDGTRTLAKKAPSAIPGH